MIQLALNGNRNEARVPRSTEEIIRTALAAVAEGAESIHFHVSDDRGRETLAGKWVDEQLYRLKESIPHTPLGISTGAWIEPDLGKRLEQIKNWNVLPHFVSINFDEQGYEEVVRLVASKGIRIEAGLSDAAAAQNFIDCSREANFLRVLIEPQENTFASAVSNVQAIEALLKDSRNRLSVLLHGMNNTCWELLHLAIEKGYSTRIGFEDTLQLPDGRAANSNIELLKEALKIKEQKTSRRHNPVPRLPG